MGTGASALAAGAISVIPLPAKSDAGVQAKVDSFRSAKAFEEHYSATAALEQFAAPTAAPASIRLQDYRLGRNIPVALSVCANVINVKVVGVRWMNSYSMCRRDFSLAAQPFHSALTITVVAQGQRGCYNSTARGPVHPIRTFRTFAPASRGLLTAGYSYAAQRVGFSPAALPMPDSQ